MKYYAADIVFPVTGPAIKKGVVAMDDQGVVKGVYNPGAIDDSKIEFLKGALVPGFINAHCHLELSHLAGVLPEHTGLPQFLLNVMKERNATSKDITKAMEVADKTMYQNGIQAVGDHVNSAISAKIKEKSPIRYHTFVEIISLKDEEIDLKIDQAREVEFHFDAKHSSITLHAPYSCSKELFKAFKKVVGEDNIISIHNQESEEENKFFRYTKGDFLNFFKELGIPLDSFRAQARNSLQTYLPYVPTKNRLILVHNTFTSMKDLDFVQRMGRKLYFCLCPNANLYIENKLPKVDNFILAGYDIVVGTDSLASNHSLDILDELKVLHTANPHLDFNETIKWITINGARALNLDEDLGSLEVGKKPGLILLQGMESFKLDQKIKVKRIR